MSAALLLLLCMLLLMLMLLLLLSGAHEPGDVQQFGCCGCLPRCNTPGAYGYCHCNG
jgi:hypothetical protein